MAKWNYEINIKQHLISEGSISDFANAANNIAKEFRKLPVKLFEGDFSTLDDLEWLEGCCEDDENIYDSENAYIGEMNYRINNLYDFADYHRIWCGL